MKIYLDNCCFNRPYDDQSQIQISLEAQAKLYIQWLIRNKFVNMVSSYVLEYENGNNPFVTRKNTIADFLKFSDEYISADESAHIKPLADVIIANGLRVADAYHIACAEYAHCDYLLTCDKKMLKYLQSKVQIVNPLDFVSIYGGTV